MLADMDDALELEKYFGHAITVPRYDVLVLVF
jgi:hypothetical protein